MIRYRFSEFTLSPQRRLLVRDGREVPLIPRYFDLLVLLIERRHEAVHRREIFERVWAETSVSDSALSQAIRTLRRTLGDDSKEPRFIRTVSRHGYRFVLAEVVEEEDDGAQPAAALPVWHWSDAAFGGAAAGCLAGGVGGLLLAVSPGSTAPWAIAPVLAVIGGSCGAIGGAGVGAGLAAADARGHGERPVSLVAAAALGGGLVGTVVQWVARWSLSALFGLDVPVGGTIEGLAIGAAAGLGYVGVMRPLDGTPVLRAMLVTAMLCGLAGLGLTLAGLPLVGGTIHIMATAADGSRAVLAPLGRLIGEPDFGPVTRSIIAFGEGAIFGLGFALGLLRRRVWGRNSGYSRQSHSTLSRS